MPALAAAPMPVAVPVNLASAPAAISVKPLGASVEIPFAVGSVGKPTPPRDIRAWLIVAGVTCAAAFMSLGTLVVGAALVWWSMSKPSAAPVAQGPASKRVAFYQEANAPSVPPAQALPVGKAKTQQWFKQAMVDAYDRHGKKGPQWDGEAREVLRQTADSWTDNSRRIPPDLNQFAETYRKAEQAGCADPLVKFAGGRVYGDSFPHDVVAQQLDKSQYHAVWRCMAWLRAARYHQVRMANDPEQAFKQSASDIEAALKLLPEIAKDKTVPSGVWLALAEQMEANVKTKINGQAPLQWIYNELNKVLPDSSVALTYKGKYHVEWAWEARGNGWANTVTPDGWRLMRERLDMAAASLEKAWEMDNSNAEAATSMLTVELGQGQGRGRMEQWFKRAMEADPNNYAACSHKLYYLEPKWHGSPEEMLAFGRECLRGGNWTGRLPFILVDAHTQLARYVKDNPDSYYQQPGVWTDLRSVYDPFLKQNPQAIRERSQYALYACRAEQWEEADRQFQALGDRVDPSVFPDRNQFGRLRAEASAKAKNGKKTS